MNNKVDDAISRQAAIDMINNYEVDAPEYMEGWACKLIDAVKGDIRGLISELPSAPPEWKEGRWIVTFEFEDCRYAKCNQCKVTQVFYYNKPLTNFCPNCGAKMKGEK